MPPPFVVAFVTGVTPGKWTRIWGERMPHSPIEAMPASDADALHALHNGTADVALLRLPIADEGLSVIPLYTESAGVVAPKDHPIAAFEAIVLADLEGETVLEGQDADTVELVAANVGVAVMPQSVARAHSRRDVVARPVTDAPGTTIALVWVAEKTTPAVEEFIGIVRGRTANSSRGQGAAGSDVLTGSASGAGPRPAGGSTAKSRQARPAGGARARQARPGKKRKGR